jgi:integron integrase
VSASTQNQALSAVLFLFEVVLGQRLGWMNNIVRAQRPVRLPVVLSRDEVASLLSQLNGPVWLMASLMYGAGLRLLECAELRVKDLNFDRSELTVRDGKGGKDRVTMLPAALKGPLLAHLARIKVQHDADLVAGRGRVALPGALRAKYPGAPVEWAWQWVFPATRFYLDHETGERRRYHLHESVLQRAVKDATRVAGISRPATCHSLRHQLRDPPTRSRVRHSNDPGAARTSRREYDHDLYPRPEPRRTRCAESARPTRTRRVPPLSPLPRAACGHIPVMEFRISTYRWSPTPA